MVGIEASGSVPRKKHKAGGQNGSGGSNGTANLVGFRVITQRNTGGFALFVEPTETITSVLGKSLHNHWSACLPACHPKHDMYQHHAMYDCNQSART